MRQKSCDQYTLEWFIRKRKECIFFRHCQFLTLELFLPIQKSNLISTRIGSSSKISALFITSRKFLVDGME
ncbi:MAG: hypothetical protein C0396_01815 [Anaerolinea sp.]|nr:hypothetical protein [Anaerolinea sp.]